MDVMESSNVGDVELGAVMERPSDGYRDALEEVESLLSGAPVSFDRALSDLAADQPECGDAANNGKQRPLPLRQCQMLTHSTV